MSSHPRPTFSLLGVISSFLGAIPTHPSSSSSTATTSATCGSGVHQRGPTSPRTYSSVAAAAAASQPTSANAAARQSHSTTSSDANVRSSPSPSSPPAAAAAATTTGVSSSSSSSTSPSSAQLTRTGATASITIPMPRRRGSYGSDGSTGGYVEKPGAPMYIGGTLETGEVKFYKLDLMRAKMSDTSLDRMSL